MGAITIRRLGDDVIDGLKRRAERTGHSMEEEVRSILSAAVADEKVAYIRMLRNRMESGGAPDSESDSADLIREFRDQRTDWSGRRHDDDA